MIWNQDWPSSFGLCQLTRVDPRLREYLPPSLGQLITKTRRIHLLEE